jgi:soluble lytic murein transglycosylase-like protein
VKVVCPFVSTLVLSVLLASVAYAETDDKPIVLTNVPAGQASKSPQPTVKVYKYTDKNGVVSFSDRAPMRTKYEVVSYSCYACNPASKVDWYNTPLHMQAFEYPINSAAKKFGVDPALVRAVIHAESAFRPNAKSRKGAQGLMQLMPATAKDMGVKNAFSPAQNIQGGVRYLAWLLELHNGNTMLATAAYNAGPGAVKRHQGIPPYTETQTYVKRVKILHDRYRKQLNATELVSVSSIQ